MAKRGKVIISCAVTGSIHVPSQTPYLPITPAEIAQGAIGAAEAGAAIVHLHARDPETGRPTPDPDVFAQFLPEIRERTDVVINITTGGGHGMTVEERTRAGRRFKPELCSLNMGSMNFGLFPVLDRISEFTHQWEPEYLEMTRDFIFRNTYADIEWIVRELGAEGTRFEFECYDVGHLYNLAHFVERGVVEPPLFVQTIFGILGGIGPEPENLMHMKATADRLFGEDYYWSILGAGRHQTNLVTMGAILGGSVRVGLEDSIYLAKGQLAQANADQVAKIARILRELSLEIATPHEARQMLGLKGADRTGISTNTLPRPAESAGISSASPDQQLLT
jgi:3,5-dioxohexanoate:acetyl-CoA acetone transferase